MKHALLLSLSLVLSSATALACPNLAGTYKCVGEGELEGTEIKVITQTKDTLRVNKGVPHYFNKVVFKTIEQDGAQRKFKVTPSCTKNQIISVLSESQSPLEETTTITKTATGYKADYVVDDIEQGVRTFEFSHECKRIK